MKCIKIRSYYDLCKIYQLRINYLTLPVRYFSYFFGSGWFNLLNTEGKLTGRPYTRVTHLTLYEFNKKMYKRYKVTYINLTLFNLHVLCTVKIYVQTKGCSDTEVPVYPPRRRDRPKEVAIRSSFDSGPNPTEFPVFPFWNKPVGRVTSRHWWGNSLSESQKSFLGRAKQDPHFTRIVR